MAIPGFDSKAEGHGGRLGCAAGQKGGERDRCRPFIGTRRVGRWPR
jgi:hypothetical protein